MTTQHAASRAATAALLLCLLTAALAAGATATGPVTISTTESDGSEVVDVDDGLDAGKESSLGNVDGLSATLRLPLVIPRAQAPFPLLVTLQARGTALREGRLEIALGGGGGRVYRWQSEPLVLAQGQRTSAVLLPGIGRRFGDAMELSLGWREGGRLLPLARRELVRGSSRNHQLTLGLCLPATASEEDLRVLDRLSLERYAPVPAGSDAPDRSTGSSRVAALPFGQRGRDSGLRTLAARLEHADLPEAALAWCACDAVVIAGDQLAGLSARQVQALEQWLRGGGSACLLSDGRVAPALAELLARVARDTSAADTVARCLLPGVAQDPPDGHARLALGLGRLVVGTWPPGGKDPEREWRQSAGFLWQVRAEHAAAMASQETWSAELFAANRDLQRGQNSNSPPFEAPALDLCGELTDLLWPEKVEVIPFSMILVLFLVFVVMVGPGDWLLLGWLRARRFTWLLFPLVAIACTALTVWLSRQYLGINDHFEHLQVVDLASDGTQLRRNHFELVFSGASKAVDSPQQDALWSPLGSSSWSYGSYYRGSSETPQVPLYQGNLPGRYAVTQEVAQWTPMLRRELSFAPCQLPWTPPTAAIRTRVEVASACAPWLAATGPHSVVVVLQGGLITATHGDAGVLRRRHHGPDDDDDHPQDAYGRTSDWLTALSSHRTQGWFALGSARAPAGGPTYDDLALCDSSAGNQFLVVFAAWKDDTLWLMRCRYGDDAVAAHPRPSP